MSWPMFERVERQSRRLEEMMERLEIKPATAGGRAVVSPSRRPARGA